MDATHTKYLLHLQKQLHSRGAQTLVDLPYIVVIGNQSAGKSSLLESISGITVPRDANISTRAPFHYRMTSTSQPFSANVSLRYEFDAQGQRNHGVAEIPFGPTLFEESHVEFRLRQAQAAILQNLSSLDDIDALLAIPPEDLSSKLEEKQAPRVSKNVVCVDVRGPNLADLAFYDLPGFIQVGPEKMLVEDLVRSYITRNSIILMVLAMNGDFESQGAIEFVREVDPQGQRTIGVLTKPDLADVGDRSTRDLWYSVLTGHIEPLKYGYYCTRQPSEDERSLQLTTEEVRSQEMEYFKNTTMYLTSPDQSRLGTASLVSTISGLLLKSILQSIPKMQDQVKANLRTTIAEISNLPKPPPIDPMTHLLDLLRIFADNFQRAVEGGPNEECLIQDISKVFEEFRINIKSTAPNFRPFPDPGSVLVPFHNSMDDTKEPGFSTVSLQFLNDIRGHIQRTVTRELPGKVPFEANRRLILQFQTSWPILVKKCQEGVKTVVVAALKHNIAAAFPNYTSLAQALTVIIENLVDAKFELVNCHTLVILEVEQGPNTLHARDLTIEEAKWLKKYQDAVHKLPAPIPLLPANDKKFSFNRSDLKNQLADVVLPVGQSVAAAPAATTNSSHVDDILLSYQVELKLMADVRAYFDFAYKRMVDSIRGHIDVLFFQGVSRNLFSSILSGLEITGPNSMERCAMYLAEDHITAKKRAKLIAQQKRLQGIQDELTLYVRKLREETANMP